MKSFFWISAFLLLPLCGIYAQEGSIRISGSYRGVPLETFFRDVEQKYPVRFYYDEISADSVYVTAEFENTPVEDCLDQLFRGKGLHYYMAGPGRIIIYSGAAMKSLFPEMAVTVQEEKKSPEKLTRERLNRLQYQIFNIGTPGKSTSSFATITGHIKNFETGDPVVGANVYVAETQKGASTNRVGYFRLTLPTGNHILNFSCVGMEPTRRIVNLYSDGTIDVELLTQINALADVKVTASREGNVGEIHSGLERINIQMLKSIPALFGEPDVIKGMLTLPGVQTVGEGTSGFNVRGGKTDENLILLDQAPMYYPSHFFGIFSAVNSGIVDNAVLYKGSMPVKYGGRLSSVLEINTIEGNKEKIEGAAGISPISTQFHIDGPIAKNSTFLASFRTTYSNWVLNSIKVPELYKSKVSFYDGLIKTNLYLNEKNTLAIDVYKSNDRFQLNSDSVYNYNNAIASVMWRHTLSKHVKSQTGLSYSSFGYNIANETNVNQAFRLTHSLEDIGLKSNFEYSPTVDLKFNFGADVDHYSVNPGERIAGNLSDITSFRINREKAIEFGVYAGSEYSLTRRLRVEGGFRFSGMLGFGNGKRYIYAPGMPFTTDNIIDTLITPTNRVQSHYVNPEFRFSANYSLDRNSSVKLSYSKTAQYIHMLSNTTAISPTDTWKLSDTYLAPQTGRQVSAGYFRNLNDDKLETSLEVFYKRIYNIKEFKPGAELLLNDHIETEVLNGLGKSYGVEFSLEKKGGRVFGRVNYTYSRTLIKSDTKFREEIVNNGEYFPANYDKPHNLTLLANLKAYRRLVFSSTVNYSTGRPITYPVAQYKLGDQVFLHYSKYNEYRIPDYFRVDLSVTLNGSLKAHKLARGTFTFSLYNVTGRKNAYSVYFKSEGATFDAYRLSIFGTVIPTITYNLNF